MKIAQRLVLLAAVAAAGFWLWTILFPSPEKIIRSRLAGLARTASFHSDGNALAAMMTAKKIGNFFSPDAEIAVDIPGSNGHRLSGREEIIQAAAAAFSTFGEMKVEFLDINVTVAPDKNSATADLTVRVTAPGKRDSTAEEMKFSFQKINGDWLIARVETVRVFT